MCQTGTVFKHDDWYSPPCYLFFSFSYSFTGHESRIFTHTEDVGRALRTAMDHFDEVEPIIHLTGDSGHTTLREMGDMIASNYKCKASYGGISFLFIPSSLFVASYQVKIKWPSMPKVLIQITIPPFTNYGRCKLFLPSPFAYRKSLSSHYLMELQRSWHIMPTWLTIIRLGRSSLFTLLSPFPIHSNDFSCRCREDPYVSVIISSRKDDYSHLQIKDFVRHFSEMARRHFLTFEFLISDYIPSEGNKLSDLDGVSASCSSISFLHTLLLPSIVLSSFLSLLSSSFRSPSHTQFGQTVQFIVFFPFRNLCMTLFAPDHPHGQRNGKRTLSMNILAEMWQESVREY